MEDNKINLEQLEKEDLCFEWTNDESLYDDSMLDEFFEHIIYVFGKNIKNNNYLIEKCKQLKAKLNPKLKNALVLILRGQTGLCKAKEFTKCNPINCKLYTIDELATIVDLQNRNTKLEQECEKYKKGFKEDFAFCNELINDKLKIGLERIRYKQVLDEIEEFCLVYRENPVEGIVYDKILDIIGKVKDKNEKQNI